MHIVQSAFHLETRTLPTRVNTSKYETTCFLGKSKPRYGLPASLYLKLYATKLCALRSMAY